MLIATSEPSPANGAGATDTGLPAPAGATSRRGGPVVRAPGILEYQRADDRGHRLGGVADAWYHGDSSPATER